MFAFVGTGQRKWMSVGLALVCALTAQSAAANVWQSALGQTWFWESRSWSGEAVGGTWWAHALEPGKTYTIAFEVEHLKGRLNLHAGERGPIAITRTGWHSYDFKIWQGSKRNLMFVAGSNNVTAGLRKISVWASGGGGSSGSASSSGGGSSGGSGGGNWMPKGHYLHFDRQRNLKTEVMDLIDRPYSAQSNWHMGIARDIHDAFRLGAVKGFSVRIPWRALEVGDGRYNWKLLDDSMAVARRYGIKFIVQVGYRSFGGGDPVPGYFPNRYKAWSSGGGNGGFVPKLWDPWVSSRLARLYKQIAWRYSGDSAFGGISTTETALGSATNSADYSYWKYRTALIKVATETQQALKNGRFFLYMNFVPGGDSSDMRKDGRVGIVNNIPHHSLAIGGPDITPDMAGMPGNTTSFRVHMRRTKPHIDQFCHLQNVDQGDGWRNKKTNQHRRNYMQRVDRVRNREKQSWFNDQKAIFVFDDLRTPNGNKVTYHPDWVLGQHWHPREVFQYAQRNFDCDYVLWNYRENVHNRSDQFWWDDIRPIIVNNANL